MRLDSYLSETGLARSRTHAKNLIIVGKVSVNGKIAQKASDDVSSADNIEVDFSEDYSSLGGIKLKRALEYFKLDPAGKICIDIGASRLLVGGEDKLLQRGIFRNLKSVWIGIDVFNLFDISNVNSYYWVTDITNAQYAVPNYLTRRQINLRLSIDF